MMMALSRMEMFAAMAMVILQCVLVHVHALESGEDGTAWRIDGFESDRDSWYIQVDGVMGGKSSGSLKFLDEEIQETVSNPTMAFSGTINLDGGGFSSVRRRIKMDLADYAGIVVTLETDVYDAQDATAPAGIELQFGDATSRYDFSSAFAVPLSSNNGLGTTVTSVYLPIESFDRGTLFGFVCRNDCRFNPSRVDSLSVYVLFQEGDFDVRIRSIEAVSEPRSFPAPAIDVSSAFATDIVDLLSSTVARGDGLYDKSYVELCVAIYWSTLNTLVASDLDDPLQALICAGLEQAQGLWNGDVPATTINPSLTSKEASAWALRYTIDALVADLMGKDRSEVVANLEWLPPRDSDELEATCFGRTSLAPGILYNGQNDNALDEDEWMVGGGNATFSINEWYEQRLKSDKSNSESLLPRNWIFSVWTLGLLVMGVLTWW